MKSKTASFFSILIFMAVSVYSVQFLWPAEFKIKKSHFGQSDGWFIIYDL